MKPRVKNDSWCYTTSNTAARQLSKRQMRKQHRRDDKDVIRRERESLREDRNGAYIGRPLV